MDSKDKLKGSWIGQIYQSNFSVKSRGVAILLRKGVPFKQNALKTDREGRYIILSGEIYGFPITLINVYGPNNDEPDFFRKVFSLIPKLSQTNLVIGGDFNCVLDAYLDRSSLKIPSQSNSRNFLNAFIKNYSLIDIWRLMHPTDRDYTFHSHVHNVYTRIDFFLVDNNLISNILNSKIHDILISDHAPVSFEVVFDQTSFTRPLWRMDPQLIDDPKFIDFMSLQLEIFFNSNDKPETSSGLLWETLKAFIRGCVISYQGSRNKLYKTKLTGLANQIHQLDIENALNPSLDTYKKILQLRYEYNNIVSTKINRTFHFIKQKYFEFGERPHKLLARQLRKIDSERTIHKIKTKGGTHFIASKDINQCFKDFYSKLYSSNTDLDPQVMDTFLRKCNLPRLSPEDKASLNKDISLEELKNTINTLKSGKTPGPDGLPVELYKKFTDTLTPYLLKTFQQALTTGLPPTFSEAIITVIPKKGKNPEEVEAYRPISLLNVDQKVLSKTLANRLCKLINKLVNTDQNGFIPGRSTMHNIRRLFNIIYHPKAVRDNLVVISLDAEKAFDRVEWPYLFAVLEKFDMGDEFITWIKILYSSPAARVLTNKTISDSFSLQRGTRQGCPLSPLLFALSVEPLAETIRSNSCIHGFSTSNTINKISLYADDILLYITQPQVSLPVILKTITTFGKFSGFKVNLEKSELMPIGLKDLSLIHSSPFKVSKEKIVYLGIVVTYKYSLLFKSNFNPLLSKLQNCIHYWRTLPISLMGRINAIKMIFLPQILYLFRNIPILLPKSFFKRLDSIILPFLWNYKSHRIKKVHLCKSKHEGGLALPDFRLYYWATHLQVFALWLEQSAVAPDWLQIERDYCHPYDLGAVLLSPVILDQAAVNNIVIKSQLRVWRQMREYLKIKSLSLLIPIANNPSFPPSRLDTTFTQWKELGICTIKDLYLDGALASFMQLQQKYNLPKNHFFRFLQIRNYLRTYKVSLDEVPPSVIDDCLIQFRGNKCQLSLIYGRLLAVTSPSTKLIREEWEREIGVGISEEVWQSGLEDIDKQSVNTRLCLIQFKVLHRLHFSKKKLHRIFPNISPICDKCKREDADLAHSFIFCHKIQGFWCELFKVLSDILNVNLAPDPVLIILGHSNYICSLNSAQQKFLTYCLITAKKLLLLFWKKVNPPTIKLWLEELISTLHLERTRYLLKGNIKQFHKIWDPFFCYLKSNYIP